MTQTIQAPAMKELIKNKPTIVHVVTHYPPHVGGMENVAYEIATGFVKKNWPVQVITSLTEGYDLPREEKSGIYELYRLKKHVELARNPVMLGLLGKLRSIPKRAIIHLHMSHVGPPEAVFLVSKMRRIPYIAHYHIDVNFRGLLGLLLSIYEKVSLGPILRKANRIMACSEENAEVLITKFSVDPKKIILISNGVADYFFKSGPRALPQDTLKLLFVGRLAARKRADLILDAISITKAPVELTIVGDGEERSNLEKQAKRLGLNNVTFTGAKTGNELAKHYQSADVFVLPSEREGGCPLVALEAMASGLPIIGADALGVRQLIADCGIVTEPSNKAFAQVFDNLWQDKRQLSILGRQSFAKAKNYSWSNLIKKMEPVYEEVFKEHG